MTFANGGSYRARSRPPPPLALIPTQIANMHAHAHHNAHGNSSASVPHNITTPLPLPVPYASIHHSHLNGHTAHAAHTPNLLPLPLPTMGHKKGANGTTNGRHNGSANGPHGNSGAPFAGDAHYRMPDGWLVPIHRAWTRGDFVVVSQPFQGTHWLGFRVNVNVLINASLWFKNELVSPPEYGQPAITCAHIVIHEPVEVAELLLHFLHLGREGTDSSSLRPTLDQYFLLYHAFVRLQFKGSMCQVLRHHADSFGGDLVESVGRTASKGDVFKLLELARVFRSSGVWNAILDAEHTSHGWSVIHNPWDLDFDDVLQNNEVYNVLVLIQRLSAIDDAPLHEFRVAYDKHDTPYVYHQDSESEKFSAY